MVLRFLFGCKVDFVYHRFALFGVQVRCWAGKLLHNPTAITPNPFIIEYPLFPHLAALHLRTRAPISGANQYSKFHHYMEKSRTACIEFSYASLHLLIYFPFFLCTCRISFSPPEYVFKWISWASWPGAGEQTVISSPIPVGGLQTVERTLIHFCTSIFLFFANV